jgi:hypothetical protein
MSLMMPDAKNGKTNPPGMKNSQQPPVTQNPSGQQQTQSTASSDFSAYSPGKAQPMQTQSQGSPYQPASKESPYANMRPGVYAPRGKFYGGDPAQGLAQAQRQRDAFVMQMNQATLPYQMANVFGKDLGAPNYDFQGMLGRANKMVEDGFYNPFTQYYNQDLTQTLGQYAAPPAYDLPEMGGPARDMDDLFAAPMSFAPDASQDSLRANSEGYFSQPPRYSAGRGPRGGIYT